MNKITKIIGTSLVCFSLVVVALSLGNSVSAAPTSAPNVGDMVFTDTNGNGIQDAGELGINGVTVSLYKSTDLNTVLSTTTTATIGGVAGVYYLYPTTTGDFMVKFTAPSPSAWIWTKMDQGSDDTIDSDVDSTGWTKSFNIASTTTSKLDLDAGLTQPSCIGQYVFEDRNGNGKWDATDAGIPSAQVTLVKADGTTVMAGSDSTGTGKYSFCNLQAGTYTVKIDRDQSAIKDYKYFSYGYDATTLQSYSVTVPTNTLDTSANFGYISYARMGSLVWMDTNKDCLLSAGEKGIPNVKVLLKNAAGTVINTKWTDSLGNYWFVAPSNQAYTVAIDPDWVTTTTSKGGSATCGTSKTTAVLQYQQNYGTLDFGFYMPNAPTLATTGSDMYLTLLAGISMLTLGYAVSRKFKKNVA